MTDGYRIISLLSLYLDWKKENPLLSNQEYKKEKSNINSSLNGLATRREKRTAIIINGSFTYILT